MPREYFLVVLTLVAGSVSVAAQEPTIQRRIPRGAVRAYQGQSSAARTERFSRKIKLGRDGRFSVSNIAGDITITGGSGDEVSIEAIKQTDGDQQDLARVVIEVDTSNGRVDVRTIHPSTGRLGAGRTDYVRVDYTITVPVSAEAGARSVSGNIRVSGVQGVVRAQTVSGRVTTSATPKLESARTVSGDVDINDIASDRGLTAGSVSGTLRAKNVKAQSLDLNTVSGDVTIADATCDRVDARSVSGRLEYAGSLVRNGRYDFNSHSGSIRLTLPDTPGFSLTANSFSGSIRSDLPLTIGSTADRDGGIRRGRGFRSQALQGTFGDGSALLLLRTFSGDIVVSKR